MRRFLFVEQDQVVVRALNLKTATTVVCRSERQKKALRKMGFIEDRIEIRRPPPNQVRGRSWQMIDMRPFAPTSPK